MSRRHRRRRREGGRHAGEEPGPPTRKIRMRDAGGRDVRVVTEVHDAVMSLGDDDRTRRLSGSELRRQTADEIGYMFRKSGAHLSRACDAISDLCSLLF